MKMTELLRYDIPPEVIRLWQEQESESLLPLQEMAVKRHKLFSSNNLLIQAPTSSGKTFIGEMATLQTALRRKKVVYLVPLKALAEEKYEEFMRKYESYGVRVIISTRDHREFDGCLETGSYSIAVVVYEKLAQLLVRRPEQLHEIELIIADELEILSDPDRGAQIELLLTRILHARRDHATPRLIALSAVIGQAGKLANWLEADLVSYDRRPVDLRFGILHEGTFRYKTYNDLIEGEEELVPIQSESTWEILTENLCRFAAEGESCLVFVKAKHESRRGAELLADRADLSPASEALEKIEALEQTHCRDALIRTLSQGVGFHNADLSREERLVVEEAFRTGEIKVLVSTSTLAVGLNLPARNVFISSDKWQYDRRFGMPWKAPILRSEYENMGGRAGRYGGEMPFGRSLLVAASPFDHETLWRRYVEGEREEIQPQLMQYPLEDHIIRLVASRVCLTEDALRDFLDRTLTGVWVWSSTLTLDEIGFRIRAAVNRAFDAGAIDKTPDGRLEATPFGQAMAAKGISLATAKDLSAWIGTSETRQWIPFDLILAAALTQDGRMLQLTLTTAEYDEGRYIKDMKALTRDEEIGPDVPMNRFRNCTLTPFFEEMRSIKAALILQDWIDESAIFDIEERYRTLKGQIVTAAEQVGWLIDAAAAIASAFGCHERFVSHIQDLSDRIAFGVFDDALPLARLRVPGIDRNTIAALKAQHLHTPETLAGASEDLLARWMTKRQARTLQAWARAEQAQTVDEQSSAAASPPPARLIIDDRHPGAILLDGNSIPLQDKQYRLIRALASAPGECVPYDTIYDAVWGELVVEPNQMHFQKRRLLERITAVLPQCAKVVSTVPKRGFVLNLSPEEVDLRATAATTAA